MTRSWCHIFYEDANIFAPNLHDMGLMSKRDFDNYYKFFQTLQSMIKPPDLLIYLKASVPALVGQIQKRGREYEENIRLDYLKKLNELYNKWIDNYKEGPVLIVDIDKNHFPEKEEDFGEILNKVDATLFGLFWTPPYRISDSMRFSIFGEKFASIDLVA